MSQFVSYLSTLKFDEKLKQTFHAKYIRNTRIVLLIVFFILAIGITSLLTLPHRLNPEIKLTIVQVVTVLPGAGPEDIESLITIPLENKLNGVKNLDTITSSSQDNVSVIALQFLSGTDKDKARTDVQNLANEVTTLPTNAKTPKVEAFDFENQPIWTFTITGNADDASLMRFTDSLKTKVKNTAHVDRVDLAGFDTQEIQIIVNQQKIKEMGISPLQVSQAIKTATQAYPAGTISTSSLTFSLAIEKQADSLQDLRSLLLTFNSQPVRLGDIAEITLRSKPDQAKVLFLKTGENKAKTGVTFAVNKTSSADIDKTVKAVENVVNTEIANSQGRFQLHTLTNSAEEISKQFTDLMGEFQSTLILVFINLFLFLGLRQALIAIMTIPLTFLLSFMWMQIFGQTINFISLFALLLAFGTSIDDTIVTVSAMTAYDRTKKFTPMETGLLVWRDFIVPIWTTTITTVWAFLPLILSTGIIGEFIKPIPLVVATTMYSSTFVAWFITLPLIIVLLRPNIPRRLKVFVAIIGMILLFGFIFVISPKNAFLIPIFIALICLFILTYRIRNHAVTKADAVLAKSTIIQVVISRIGIFIQHGVISTEPISRRYRMLISRVLSSKHGRRTVLICIATFTLSAYLLLPLGLVKNEFFPKTNSDTLYVNVELPAGTNAQILEETANSLLIKLDEIPYTESVMAETQSSVSSTRNGPGSSNNSISFTLNLIPKEKRSVDSSFIAEKIRQNLNGYQKGKISVVEASGGPPAGSDIQIKLLGDNLTTLNHYADTVEAYLQSQKGLNNINRSVKGGTSKIVFVPDKIKLAQTGISLDAIGLWLRTYASGLSFDSVKFNDVDEDIVFYTSLHDQSPQTLNTIQIPTQNGSYPLSSLGTFALKNNPTIITREGGKRTISVSAGVSPGYTISDINKKLEKFANTTLQLPNGYSWKTGGVNDENQKSVNSILQAMGLSFLLIMATMVIEFGSYRQAAMILSLIPFAISGVFIIFAVTGTPLSFPALIGVLALFGIVVTNAMFIVEKINQNRKQHMPLNDAIADAAEGRLEPIMLTSITSILGLVPITIANPLWRGLGGAIISGLLFSGLIMLFFIPVMYHVLFSSKAKADVKSV